ncbi:MAG TPA: hypothetical protein VNW72_09190 [Chthoniobacterales bacterium]|jgi:hypothetical protein|nr:hypothetical protein [Chthoniobacterales bacterium]
MISLSRKDFPSPREDLAQALDAALHRFVQKTGRIVDLRSRVFPLVDEIRINLDRAKFDSAPPPLAKTEGDTALAFETAVVTMSGRNISVRGVPLDLRMEMRDVVFHKGTDANGDAVMLIHRAREGQLVLSAAQLDLEEAIGRLGGEKARLWGVDLEQVRLAMRARSRRSLAADIKIQAKKFFARANIDIYAQLDISNEFVAKISEMKCKGDGKLGSFACAALQPLFEKLKSQSFPLKALPLGGLRIVDVHVAVADTVELTVDFGSEV